MFIVAIVSGSFLLIGLLLLSQYLYFSRYGIRIKAKVRALEKFSSVSNNRETRVYYRPVSEFFFKGRRFFIWGGGRSNIVHKIGDEIGVFIINDNAYKSILADGSFPGISIFIILFGFIGSCVYMYRSGLIASLFYCICLILIPVGIYIYLKKKNKFNFYLEEFLTNNNISTEFDFKKENIFEYQFEISKETNKTHKAGKYISLAILFIDSLCLYTFFKNLNEAQLIGVKLFFNNLLNLNFSDIVMHKYIIILLIMIYVLVIFLYSFIYCSKKIVNEGNYS